jgi:hypothetical protein
VLVFGQLTPDILENLGYLMLRRDKLERYALAFADETFGATSTLTGRASDFLQPMAAI